MSPRLRVSTSLASLLTLGGGVAACAGEVEDAASTAQSLGQSNVLAESARAETFAEVALSAAESLLRGNLDEEARQGRGPNDCRFSEAQCEDIREGTLRRSLRSLHDSADDFGLRGYLRELDGHTDPSRARAVNAKLQTHLHVDEPLERRLAALHLILATAQLHTGPLSPGAFASLETRPATEQMMVLEAHRVHPPPREVRADLVELGSRASTPLRLRQRLSTALGHADTGDELMTVIGSIRRDHPISHSLAFRFGSALGRCGTGCEPLVAELVASASSPRSRCGVSRSSPRKRRFGPFGEPGTDGSCRGPRASSGRPCLWTTVERRTMRRAANGIAVLVAAMATPITASAYCSYADTCPSGSSSLRVLSVCSDSGQTPTCSSTLSTSGSQNWPLAEYLRYYFVGSYLVWEYFSRSVHQ